MSQDSEICCHPHPSLTPLSQAEDQRRDLKSRGRANYDDLLFDSVIGFPEAKAGPLSLGSERPGDEMRGGTVS